MQPRQIEKTAPDLLRTRYDNPSADSLSIYESKNNKSYLFPGKFVNERCGLLLCHHHPCPPTMSPPPADTKLTMSVACSSVIAAREFKA